MADGGREQRVGGRWLEMEIIIIHVGNKREEYKGIERNECLWNNNNKGWHIQGRLISRLAVVNSGGQFQLPSALQHDNQNNAYLHLWVPS